MSTARGEPYHYVMMSYDERGRVEAVLRYTENLGFDAVYYRYNSLNEVIAICVADPFRQFTTWYGFDHNGRVDSVWTRLQNPFSGLLVSLLPSQRADSLRYPAFPVRSTYADILYTYTKTGQLDSVIDGTNPFLPKATIAYDYTRRKFFDSMQARLTGLINGVPYNNTLVFRQKLDYDSAGQIIRQESQHSSQPTPLVQDYGYDAVQRLTTWKPNHLSDTAWSCRVAAWSIPEIP